MKMRITFKSPDAVDYAIGDYIEQLTEDEQEEFDRSKVEETLGKWITYGEYVTIEFDLETQTATVVPDND